MNNLCNDIRHVHQSYSSSVVFWIGGDLNLPDICWDRATITGMQYPKTLSEQLFQLTEDLNMEQ